MGQTFAEKILAKKAGVKKVQPGEIVEVTPDVALSHDNSAAIYGIFKRMGGDRVFNPGAGPHEQGHNEIFGPQGRFPDHAAKGRIPAQTPHPRLWVAQGDSSFTVTPWPWCTSLTPKRRRARWSTVGGSWWPISCLIWVMVPWRN